MSAGAAVRAALAAALRRQAGLGGVAVFEGRPADGVLPRVEVAEGSGFDWSAAGMRGRELWTAVTVRVADGQAARMGALAEAVERAGEALAGDVGGWRVAGAVFVRSRAATEKGGVVVVLVEHRVRVVEI